MYNMRLADVDLCIYCFEEEETAVHVQCQCEGLVRLQHTYSGGTLSLAMQFHGGIAIYSLMNQA
ncbi:hypothetical protein O3M35_001705 [Rhynocoris fuscipes]|uniref:Uncharacterized protein n=1 Tax=Rhynocoris fuscipes TaxID=488301 RepID=A0AAW1CSH6_9HEMI